MPSSPATTRAGPGRPSPPGSPTPTPTRRPATPRPTAAPRPSACTRVSEPGHPADPGAQGGAGGRQRRRSPPGNFGCGEGRRETDRPEPPGADRLTDPGRVLGSTRDSHGGELPSPTPTACALGSPALCRGQDELIGRGRMEGSHLTRTPCQPTALARPGSPLTRFGLRAPSGHLLPAVSLLPPLANWPLSPWTYKHGS